MLTIEYNPIDGATIADGNIDDHIKSLFDFGSAYYITSNSNVIWKARLFALENDKKIEFVFEQNTITPNKYGAIIDWPDGFCDLQNRCAEGVLRIAIKKRKEEKDANKSTKN